MPALWIGLYLWIYVYFSLDILVPALWIDLLSWNFKQSMGLGTEQE
jgi:hypothetical protein